MLTIFSNTFLKALNKIIEDFAKQWSHYFSDFFVTSGILLPTLQKKHVTGMILLSLLVNPSSLQQHLEEKIDKAMRFE